MYTIFRNKSGLWVLESVEKPETIKRFKTQKEAINASRSYSSKGDTVIVHKVDGTIGSVFGFKQKSYIKTVKTSSKIDINKLNKAIASTVKINDSEES